MFHVPRHRWAKVAACALVAVGTVTVPAATAGTERPCNPTEFFVSPEGNDRRGAGTADNPWRTINRARDHIADHGLNRPDSMECDIVVNLAAGDYPVRETVSFTAADSGSNGHQVIYRSADGPGKARLVGAQEVTGWRHHEGNIYRARVDADDPFYTLFEDGDRATTARYPNRRSDDVWAPYLESVLKEPEKEAVRQWLYSNPGEWDPTWDLDDAQVVIWSGGSWSWFTDTVPIQNPSFDDNQITLEHWTRYALINSRSGSRYFLQNSLDFLDQPGEYYLDIDAGELYYWPRSGSIDDSTIMRPTVRTVLDIAGDSPASRAHDIVFDGLHVQYSDFVDWYRYGWISDGDSGHVHKYPEYDRQIEMPRNRFGAVRLTNTSHIELRNMRISDTGFTAVYLLFANDHVTVSGSLLENLGGDGIKVEGPYPGEGDVAGHNVFTNNYIHHYGELVPGDAAGVELLNTGNNEVSHSVIEHSARYAISLEVRPEVTAEDNYAHGNTFKYLNLQQAGLDSGDMGAFYTYGVDNAEPHPITNRVFQVVIGDVIPDESMPDSGTRGVHMDAGGCGFSFTDIEVGQVTDQKYQSYQCNQVHNANWEDDFDQSRMEYDRIGVTDAFPYPRPPATTSPTR